jgi:outer membrane protein assembly factor BamB
MRRMGPVFLAVLALAPSVRAAAPPATTNPLVADGSVQSVQRFGPDLLLRGSFDHIGPYVGSGLGMDPASGAIDPAFPRFDGQVSDVIDDGSGGWYVGGSFLIGGSGPVQHIAHVLASGGLDPNYKDASGDLVTALALADGKLYATRWFKGGVRAFDPATGQRITAFEQDSPAQASELELADGRLYVGGSDQVIALDPVTGSQLDAFSCDLCDTGQVSALAHDDTRLFVGERGGRLFAVGLATGAPDTGFRPSPGHPDADYVVDNGPLVLAVDGSRLLVGGRHLLLGGPSSTLDALDTTTGAADPSFAAGFNQPVHDMVLRGDTIVASGAGENAKTPAALVTLDRTSGAVQSTVDTSLDGPVDALAGTGARVFVGGRFTSRARIATRGVALVDARTGALVPGFAVSTLYYDYNVLATSRALLFWRTSFGDDYNRETLHLKAVSMSTGQTLLSFHARPITYNPNARTFLSTTPGGQSYDPAVLAEGNRIYVGHVLGNPNTTWPRSRIQVLSVTSGRTVRKFDLPLPGYVTSLAKRGSRLYVGGSFRRFRNGRPAHLATLQINPSTGASDSAFDAHTHGPVYGLGINDDRLYLTGIFNRIYPIHQPEAAAVDLVHGYVDPRFRPRTGGFTSFYIKYDSPIGIGPGLVDLPGYYNYPANINIVDGVTGRRVAFPFSTSAVTALLPVGRRYYVSAALNMPFSWSGPYTLNLTGFAG